MAFLNLALVAASLLLGGCSHVSYLWQAGVGQLAIYNRERPLQEVIEDPTTPSEVRERLRWIPEIKKMVESELGVEATSNYTTYVNLKRPFVIWSITIAEPFEVKLKEWSFPIVGSFPYLGFFKEDMARDWLKDYSEKGFDTYIRGVTAYSTLGYLRDPLLSSMLSRDKADLVNLIYHETTHGQIYLNNQGQFNEELASYIGDYGEREWLVRSYGAHSKEVESWESDRADRRRFGELMRAFADELKKYYKDSEGQSADVRESGKQSRFASMRSRLEAEKWKGRGMARATKLLTNNAALLAFLTYEDDQHIFDLLDKKCGGSVKRSLRYLKRFASEWEKTRHPVSRDGGKPVTPQSVLYDRLLNALGIVCLDLDGHGP